MRKIESETIVNEVAKMCIEANYNLGCDIYNKINAVSETEESPIGRDVLKKLIQNADIAKKESIPICQDTGMAVFFVEIGNEVIVEDMTLNEAINEGVKKGYKEGYLRKSVVSDPLLRVNTSDNTPAIIYIEFVKGDKLTIEFAPKGFGSENMSRVKMLKPSDGVDGVKDFVIETVRIAGSNPCPPIVVGVGIGGNNG